jgi:3-dehydroquinate dehydratase-2
MGDDRQRDRRRRHHGGRVLGRLAHPGARPGNGKPGGGRVATPADSSIPEAPRRGRNNAGAFARAASGAPICRRRFACYKAGVRRGPLGCVRLPTVFILNGPNLNLLGVREPATYGYDTLADVEERCLARAAALDLAIDFRQTNHEGQLVDWIQEAREAADGIILNAGAFTHTSVAILDALNAADLPVIEVHLSNIFRRENFRHHSYVSLAARGVICGLGPQGYELALEALASVIEAEPGEAAR